MRNVKNSIKKRFMILAMAVIMLTGTATTGYVETVQADTTVYITRTGSKYHTHKCGNGTYFTASRSSAISMGLTPCQKCFPYGDSSSSSSSDSFNHTNNTSNSTQPAVKKMKINKSSLELVKGQTATLKVSHAPGSVKWSSSDSSIVAVSSSGKLRAKAKGKVAITVTSGNQQLQCKVMVEEPKLNKTELTMNLKETANLKLSGCKHSVKWSSGDSDIVKVSNGKLTAKEVGKTVVKAKVHGKTYSCKVTVKKPDIKSITVGENNIVMECIDYQSVYIKLNPSYAEDYYDVTVTSSDSSIVSAELLDGWNERYVELYSKNIPGQAVITVTAGGKSASFTVNVIDESVMDEEEEAFISKENRSSCWFNRYFLAPKTIF